MNTSLDCCSKVEVARSPLKVQSHGISLKKNLQTDGTQVRPKEDLPIQLDQANVKVERFPTVRQSLRVNFNGNLSFQVTSNLSKLSFSPPLCSSDQLQFLESIPSHDLLQDRHEISALPCQNRYNIKEKPALPNSGPQQKRRILVIDYR